MNDEEIVAPDGADLEKDVDLEVEWTSRLPDELKGYVTAIAAQFRIGNAVPAALAIGVASAALGRGIQVKTTFGRVTSPNLYLLGAAETSGYKTSIAGPIFEALYKCADRNRAREGGRCCVVVEDATPESLAEKAHSTGGVLASLSSDANGALTTHMGKYSKFGQPDVSLLLKGFSNEELRQDRIGRAAVSARVCFAITWLLQTPIVQALYRNQALVDQGLLGRFLVFPFSKPVELVREEIAPPIGAQKAFDDRISELVNSFHSEDDVQSISASEEARDLLTVYEKGLWDDILNGRLQSIAGLVKRRSEIAWRVALVLHAFEHGEGAGRSEIAGETAAAAVLFLYWCSAFQEELAFRAADADDAERLDKAMTLLKFNRGGVSARDLCRKSSSFFPDTASALATLRELEAEGGVYSKYCGKSLRFFLGARGAG